MSCPVCGCSRFEGFYPDYEGPCVSSDFMVVPDSAIDNRICTDCGLIFNACGVRDLGEGYYRDSYGLMSFDQKAEIKSFTNTGPRSQAERSCDTFLEMVKPEEGVHVLEAGAGKGSFLRYLRLQRPDITVEAFEPSEAFEILAENLPDVDVAHSDYKRYNLNLGCRDVVVSLGVLEHVQNPLDMLRWKRRMLKPGGTCFIRVPNFARNPNDVFTADHLSKLTIPTLGYLAVAAGFRLVETRHAGVAIHAMLVADQEPASPDGVFDENIDTVRANERYARQAVETVGRAREAAHVDGSGWAVFGLAASGLFAPLGLGFDPAEITAYVDQNPSLWGVNIHGRPVIGLETMGKMGVGHVALVISPVYHDKVRSELEQLGVCVHTPG